MDLMTLTFAYLDPGTGSMLLQAIVGGSSGLFVLVRHFWKAFQNRSLKHSVHQRVSLPDVPQ